jgi:hypothetical protein
VPIIPLVVENVVRISFYHKFIYLVSVGYTKFRQGRYGFLGVEIGNKFQKLKISVTKNREFKIRNQDLCGDENETAVLINGEKLVHATAVIFDSLSEWDFI